MLRTVEVFQTNNREYIFMGYDFVKTCAEKVSVKTLDYELVYKSSFDLCETDEVALELLFTKFNIDHPEDYRCRSLSVSDIVRLDGIDYFVDNIGFKKLEVVDDHVDLS